jgi:pimeloyl-ACP methyl ester carboxylesterase
MGRWTWAHGAVLVAVIGCAPTPVEREAMMVMPALENGSFSTELNGFSIHYEVHGEGPVLMVVPNSWGLSLDGLRGLFRLLEEERTLIYFDPRGMGGSGPIRDEADMGMAAVRGDFDALRRHLGLEAVDAIGWSNGAMNLILLAAEHPETIRSAVFVHGVASFDEEDQRQWAERQPALVAQWSELDRNLRTDDVPLAERTALLKAFWVGEWFPRSCADPQATGPVLAEIFRDAEFSWAHADFANREAPVFDARDRLAAITARCLVVAGAHDDFPPDKVRELHDGLADSRFVVFASSGHFAPVEEPDGFRTAVLAFLGVW